MHDNEKGRAVLYDSVTERPFGFGFYSDAEAQAFIRYVELVPLSGMTKSTRDFFMRSQLIEDDPILGGGADTRSLSPEEFDKAHDAFIASTRCDKCGSELDYDQLVELPDEEFVESMKGDLLQCDDCPDRRAERLKGGAGL